MCFAAIEDGKMQITFAKRPKSSRHGFDRASKAAGVCVVSGRAIPPSQNASSTVKARVARSLVKLISPVRAVAREAAHYGTIPVISKDALKEDKHPLLWLLSWLP